MLSIFFVNVLVVILMPLVSAIKTINEHIDDNFVEGFTLHVLEPVERLRRQNFRPPPGAISTAGCRDGTREGFTNRNLYPKIAACVGATRGIDVSSAAASSRFCGNGWHVCTGADINAGRNSLNHHAAITVAQARSFPGKFAYNANNDCDSCQDTCGPRNNGGHSGVGCTVSGGSDPDLACMGSGCGVGNQPACIANGRLNSGNGGCRINNNGILGLMCCRWDYQLRSAPVSSVSVSGCANNRRTGFTDISRFPKIAACAGQTRGIDVRTAATSSRFCGRGWHVCTGQDINAGRNDPTHHTAITRAMAASFGGKYAYNANNDCNSCQDFCGSRDDSGHRSTGCTVGGGADPDLACMGNGCSQYSSPACLSNARFNSGNGGCIIRNGNIAGVICCRWDYRYPPTLAPTNAPTNAPTMAPTNAPTYRPTSQPTTQPTRAPTTKTPTAYPTGAPTFHPCITGHNCGTPSTYCSDEIVPGLLVLGQPSSQYVCVCNTSAGYVTRLSATMCGTEAPTAMPTMFPTNAPTQPPTLHPSPVPTAFPIASPTKMPTTNPTEMPITNPPRESPTTASRTASTSSSGDSGTSATTFYLIILAALFVTLAIVGVVIVVRRSRHKTEDNHPQQGFENPMYMPNPGIEGVYNEISGYGNYSEIAGFDTVQNENLSGYMDVAP